MSTSWYNWGLEYKVTHSLTRYSSTGSTNATRTIDAQRATIQNTSPIESHPDNAESTSNKNEYDCKSPEYWPIWAIWDWSDDPCAKTRATSILQENSPEKTDDVFGIARYDCPVNMCSESGYGNYARLSAIWR